MNILLLLAYLKNSNILYITKVYILVYFNIFPVYRLLIIEIIIRMKIESDFFEKKKIFLYILTFRYFVHSRNWIIFNAQENLCWDIKHYLLQRLLLKFFAIIIFLTLSFFLFYSVIKLKNAKNKISLQIRKSISLMFYIWKKIIVWGFVDFVWSRLMKIWIELFLLMYKNYLLFHHEFIICLKSNIIFYR